MKTSMEREKRPARDGIGDRTFWLAVAAVVAFNVLLVAWVLLQPAGPRASPIVSQRGGVIGPLLVLPLCFWWLQRKVPTGCRRTSP